LGEQPDLTSQRRNPKRDRLQDRLPPDPAFLSAGKDRATAWVI
jgi:hypothetical protein